jgi:hypothetical protein
MKKLVLGSVAVVLSASLLFSCQKKEEQPAEQPAAPAPAEQQAAPAQGGEQQAAPAGEQKPAEQK